VTRTYAQHASILAGSVLLLASLLTSCSHAPQKAAAKVEAAAAARAHSMEAARMAAAAEDADEQALERIPLPSRNVYAGIRTRRSWKNPFLVVGPTGVTLTTVQPGVSTGKRRGKVSHQHEVQLPLAELSKALAALPEEAWPFGRVIAVQEDPAETRRDRPEVRRNVEATMQLLNTLGVVSYDWPSGQR
jgi:hypothetical protein